MAHVPAGHWGYRDGESPLYQPCGSCGDTVRADRLDLVVEHAEVCRGRRRCALSPRGLPVELVDRLDEQSLSLIHEYVCRRVGMHRGDREVQVRFRDGRYQRTHVWDADRGVRTRLHS
jgi:hypothetical protein